MENSQKIALFALGGGALIVAIFWLRSRQTVAQPTQPTTVTGLPVTGEVMAAAAQPSNASVQQYVYELQKELEDISSAIQQQQQQYPLAYPQMGQTVLQQILAEQQQLQQAINNIQQQGVSAVIPAGGPTTAQPAPQPIVYAPNTPLTQGGMLTYQQYLASIGQWPWAGGNGTGSVSLPVWSGGNSTDSASLPAWSGGNSTGLLNSLINPTTIQQAPAPVLGITGATLTQQPAPSPSNYLRLLSGLTQ